MVQTDPEVPRDNHYKNTLDLTPEKAEMETFEQSKIIKLNSEEN